jgi:stearoyl-CoA 9-desaturase NADPH oxidoreductase
MVSSAGRLNLAGRLAVAARSLTTPLLPDDFLELINPLWSRRGLRGRVVQVRRETADATTLVIEPGRGWTPHRAGQWVRVGVEIEGVWQARSYSVTSAADGRSGCFAVTVKAVDGGRVSPHLAFDTTVGTTLRLEPASGEFGLPATWSRPGLFLTAGSGITPVMGMLRTMVLRRGHAQQPDLRHVHCAMRRDDVVFGDELRRLDQRLPSYRLHEHYAGDAGLLTLDQLDVLCPDWRERDTWACGPSGLLDAIEKHWANAGITHLLHVERFEATVFAAPDAAGGVVTFAGSNRCVDAAPGQPILAVGEAAGVLMPNGCRMGICFTCVAPLRSGQVRDLRTGEIHGSEGDLIQTCVSAAAGPCSIDL